MLAKYVKMSDGNFNDDIACIMHRNVGYICASNFVHLRVTFLRE